MNRGRGWARVVVSRAATSMRRAPCPDRAGVPRNHLAANRCSYHVPQVVVDCGLPPPSDLRLPNWDWNQDGSGHVPPPRAFQSSTEPEESSTATAPCAKTHVLEPAQAGCGGCSFLVSRCLVRLCLSFQGLKHVKSVFWWSSHFQ